MATVEMVYQHQDGDFLQAAEVENIIRALGGAGVFGHTVGMTVSGSDRNIVIPAFSARVPDGAGGLTYVSHSGATKTGSANGSTGPRIDIVVLDANGNLDLREGVATAETGVVAEAPMPALLDDEILVARARIETSGSVYTVANVKGRAINVTNALGAWEHIDTQVLTTTPTSISFQNIPTSYKQFRLIVYAPHSASANLEVRFNNDSGANYNWFASGNGGASSGNVAQTAGFLISGMGVAGVFHGELIVSKQAAGKMAIGTFNFFGARTDTQAGVITYTGGLDWNNVADLISRIDLLISAGTFLADARVVLEGSRTT